MKYLLTILLALLLSNSAYSLGDEFTSIFNITIGESISDEYLNSGNMIYPTQLVTLPSPDDYIFPQFKEIHVQVINKSRTVYAVIAKVTYSSQQECTENFKSVFQYIDHRFNSLKVVREESFGSNTHQIFDGYLSTDKKRKLSFHCGSPQINGTEHNFEISIWHTELQDQIDGLWDEYVGR